MLYIHVHISISMTNKSGLTFFLSIKYLSVCLMVVDLLNLRPNIIQILMIQQTFRSRNLQYLRIKSGYSRAQQFMGSTNHL